MNNSSDKMKMNSKLSSRRKKSTRRRRRRLNRANEMNNFNVQKDKTTLLGQLDEDTAKFCEAVVCPFSAGAIGAVKPDRFQDVVVPCFDRLEFDLGFGHYVLSGSWTSQVQFRPLGILIWLQPRCFADGWGEIASDNSLEFRMFSNPGAPLNANDTKDLLWQYYLCYTILWDDGVNGYNVTGFYSPGTPDVIENCYRVVPFNKTNAIYNYMSKGRICGMGLKVWSEEAPAYTGGYAVGGWLVGSDIQTCLYHGQAEDYNGEQLEKMVTRFQGAVREPGVKGVTVRYSPLQDNQQECSVVPKLNGTEVTVALVDGFPVMTPDVGVSFQHDDAMRSGSYVPAVYWRFNNTNAASGEDITAGIGTLRVMCVCHYEGNSSGNSPFMCTTVRHDMTLEYVLKLIDDWQRFPPATSGHSFKSFLERARSIVGTVTSQAGKFYQVMQLIEQFSDKVFPIVASIG